MHKIWRGLSFRARLLIWNIYRRIRSDITVESKQGVFTLPLHIDDPISRSLFVKREYELVLIREAMRVIRSKNSFLKGTGTVLDIGANNGVISIGMLVTGEITRAIAIEPDPHNFAWLDKNITQNQLNDVMVCLNCAASDQKQELLFEISETNWGRSSNS